MPTFYNYRENGVNYSFDDVFVPADAFRQGNLWTWGSGAFGQLGINVQTTTRSTPVTTFAGGTNWKLFYSGDRFTVAIKTDGTLWSWGRNEYGVLGANVTNDRSTPVTTFAGGTNWKKISCGYRHTAAIKTDGTLWTWGSGLPGQLGNNTTTQRNTPVTTFAGGTNWNQVSSSGYHTAAIKTDGTLWTWGRNSYAQLGDDSITNRSTPVTTRAGGTNWRQVACGRGFTAAIKTDGTLWTWGRNFAGQNGDNTTFQRNSPAITFAGGTNWKQVSCGINHAAAIKTDGTLWVWGANYTDGRLGINAAIVNRLTPVTTFAGGTNWKQVSCGGYHTAAIKTDGTLWIWGRNNTAQLGINNATSPICTPVTTFAGGTNWKQVSCGFDFTAATTYIDNYQ